MTKLMLPRLPHRFFHQFRPEKGAPGPKNESFQKMKETPRYSPNEQVYQIQPFSGYTQTDIVRF